MKSRSRKNTAPKIHMIWTEEMLGKEKIRIFSVIIVLVDVAKLRKKTESHKI
jgi:hypothetical protein